MKTVWCGTATKTGIVIVHDDKDGLVQIASNCHPLIGELRPYDGERLICTVCEKMFDGTAVAYAMQSWSMNWNCLSYTEDHSDAQWVAAWIGVPAAAVTFTKR